MDNDERFYLIDGVEYPSVTTITNGVTNKSFLTKWAVGQYRDAVFRSMMQRGVGIPLGVSGLEAVMAEAQEGADSYMGWAVGVGNAVHQILHGFHERPESARLVYDDFMSDEDGPRRDDLCQVMLDAGIDPNADKQYVRNCVDAWFQWQDTYPQFAIAKTEQLVWETTNGYAGTLDALLQGEGKQHILDVKTGTIHKEHGMQVAAYAYAYEQMSGTTIDNCYLLRLNRDTGGYEFRQVLDWRTVFFEAFRPAAQLWKFMKQQSIPKKL
jgi:hypothetical protein